VDDRRPRHERPAACRPEVVDLVLRGQHGGPPTPSRQRRSGRYWRRRRGCHHGRSRSAGAVPRGLAPRSRPPLRGVREPRPDQGTERLGLQDLLSYPRQFFHRQCAMVWSGRRQTYSARGPGLSMFPRTMVLSSVEANSGSEGTAASEVILCPRQRRSSRRYGEVPAPRSLPSSSSPSLLHLPSGA
jgi:hypothetical protein